MIVNLKALIVVLGVSLPALFFFMRPFSELIGRRRYITWAAFWVVTAIAIFLLQSYWLFVAAFVVILIAFNMAEPLKPAAFSLLFISVPAYGLTIPGFMGINRFIDTDPQIVMIGVLLLPAMIAAARMRKISRAGGAVDVFFLCWLLLQLALAVRAPTFTHMLRVAVETFLIMAPIYYVFSRQIKSIEDIRIVTAAFVLGGIVLSVTTIPETAMRWHFYTTAATDWVGNVGFTYKLREGALRATGPSSNPIVWGFIAMCVFGYALAALNDRIPKLYKYAGFAVIIAGLLASLSRGPWVGAAAMTLVFAATSPKSMQRLFQLGVAGGLAAAVGAMTPYGQRIIGLLPFIGDSAGETISYRQRLLHNAGEVIGENPLFGSHDFLAHPKMQALRQGEGIIDIVNSYIGVALQSGYVGLFLFLGVLGSTVLGLRGAIRAARKYDPQTALYCRAYLAVMAGVMLTIFTTSTVEHMVYLIWAMVGGAVAMIRVERYQRERHALGVTREERSGAVAPAPAAQPQFDWK